MNLDSKQSTYFIPIDDKYIIYLPYKPMAFVGNHAMVQYIQTLGDDPDFNKDHETTQMLRQIGFFAPDRRKLLSGQPESTFKPVIGVLLLTTACNMNCVYCYASAGAKQGQTMSLETGQWLIDQVCKNAQESGKTQFSLCLHGGGEPTVALQLLRTLVDYAHSSDLSCRISLTTNGYFTEQQAETLLDGISEVSLSFDGMPDIQSRQRPAADGKNSYNRIFRTLQRIEKKRYRMVFA